MAARSHRSSHPTWQLCLGDREATEGSESAGTDGSCRCHVLNQVLRSDRPSLHVVNGVDLHDDVTWTLILGRECVSEDIQCKLVSLVSSETRETSEWA